MQATGFFAGLLIVSGSAINLRTAPDVSAEVQHEEMQNIQIHDGFLAQEQQDSQSVNMIHANKDLSQLQTGTWVVALDNDKKTQMLVQKSSGIKDPCAGIECAAKLECPAGFSVTEVEGH